jgi:hypothetical protein
MVTHWSEIMQIIYIPHSHSFRKMYDFMKMKYNEGEREDRKKERSENVWIVPQNQYNVSTE